MNAKTIIAWSALAALSAVFCAACDDSRVKQSAPGMDKIHLGGDETAPEYSEIMDTPDSGELTIDFGLVDTGTIARKYLVLLSTGESILTLASLDVETGTSADFKINCSGGGPFGACPTIGDPGLEAIPGDSVVIQVAYGPLEVGTSTGAFSLLTNALDHHGLHVSLIGQGVTPEIQVCVSDCTGDQDAAACEGVLEICNDSSPDDLALDFGGSDLGQALQRTVFVRNLGDRPLLVSAVSISGGDYSQFEVEGSGFELAGGESGELNIGYNPSIGGEHASVLEIASNDINEGEIRIDLRGQGLAPRMCPDPLALNFSNINTGHSEILAFKVANCGLLDLQLSEIALADGTSSDFSLVDPPAVPVVIAPADSIDIQVQYQPVDPGTDSGGVDLFSNDPASDPDTGKTGMISLLGSSVFRACDIQATPSVVNFGGVVQNEITTIDVIVSNHGTDDCTLERAEITVNTADAEFEILDAPPENTVFGPGDTLIVSLQYTPTNLGADIGILSLFGNDMDTDEIRVDLNGEGITEPVCDLEITPASLSFGTVKVFNTKSMILLLTNRGQAECTVTNVVLPDMLCFGDDFSINY